MTRAMLGVAVALTAVFTVNAAVGTASGPLQTVVSQGFNAAVGLLCAGVCLSRRRSSEDRVAWLLIGAGIASWASGNALFSTVIGRMDPIPVPSAADPMWLAFYPLVYAGVMLLARRRLRHLGVALWLDGLIAALAGAALCITLVLGVVLQATDGQPAAVAINIVYPLGDLILILLLLGVVSTGPSTVARPLIVVTVGLIIFAISDTVYLVQSAKGVYSVGGVLDSGWLLGLLAAAYASQIWEPLGERSGDRVRLGAPVSAAALAGLAALAVLVVQALTAQSTPGMLVATAALLLVVVRMTISMFENRTMLTALHREAVTDALTGLGNRRRLFVELPRSIASASANRPLALVIFDLDGFKTYNDSFGHAAGDALLTRIGRTLQNGVAGSGAAYRLGGDEFCALIDARDRDIDTVMADLARSLTQCGQGFAVTASYGFAVAPADTRDAGGLMRQADRRMYEAKNSRRPSAATQATDALLALVHERYPNLDDHTTGVAALARAVSERMGLDGSDVDATTCAAALHDVGKVAIPDSVLNKPGPLNDEEWKLMRRHAEIGERVLQSVPALRMAAPLVRWSHERWDGKGYPDALAGHQIPIGASIVAACDSFDAMTENRSYQEARSQREALAELRRCAGTQFRPDVIDALCSLLEESSAEAISPHVVLPSPRPVRDLAIGLTPSLSSA